MIDWSIQGEEMANCNCNFGCPCQFGVLPTDGTCEAVVFFRIDKGHYGEVSLNGLRTAVVYKWPGAIHEGNGEFQLIIDKAATEDQRAALGAIMSGKDTAEMATMWFIFAAMSPTQHDTIYADISVEIDAENRVAKGSVDGVVETELMPIPNIVTGEPHRVSIQLPNGFEFGMAEMAKGKSLTHDGAALDLLKNTGTHAHIATLHLTGQGRVAA
ncbi:DUF1326 domain-containing protein [Primorskyibacter sp. S87]|uniref:DUF1326 domain-containing protein n=1 Tax=Primorskyibacter sp. S87 TaxID=3415126 RepID=UPI003C7AA273